MNNTLKQLCTEMEQMEKTIAFQKQIIDTVQKPAPTVCPYACPATSEVAYPKIKLEDCSWDEIAIYAKAGMANRFFALGDTKKVPLADGSEINVRIIGFDHDVDRDGNKLSITFETVETINRDFRMNEESTNKNGWQDSALRRVLNNSVFNELLPLNLSSVIKSCMKQTGFGGNKEKLGFTSDPLFVLSEQEIFGRKIYSIGNEGHWYDWYRQENSEYAKRKQNGESDWRWERSPYGGSTGGFCGVGSSGSAAGGIASDGCGVSFGFCV